MIAKGSEGQGVNEIDKGQVFLGKALGFSIDGFAPLFIEFLCPLNVKITDALFPVGNDMPCNRRLVRARLLIKCVQQAIDAPNVSTAIGFAAAASKAQKVAFPLKGV